MVICPLYQSRAHKKKGEGKERVTSIFFENQQNLPRVLKIECWLQRKHFKGCFARACTLPSHLASWPVRPNRASHQYFIPTWRSHMGGSWTQEALFIVHTGDSAGTTATIESYTLFPLPFLFMHSCTNVYKYTYPSLHPCFSSNRWVHVFFHIQTGSCRFCFKMTYQLLCLQYGINCFLITYLV